MVEQWKKLRPLDARLLEEVYPETISQQEIVLSVRANSMALTSLADQRKKSQIAQDLVEIFQFQGKLKILQSTGPSELLKDTLLDVKQKKKRQMQQEQKQRTLNHPMVKGILAEFGGEIVDYQESSI